MKTRSLQLNFKTFGDTRFSLSINDPIDQLEEEDLKEKMDQLIANNIFQHKGEDLKEKAGARLITRETIDIF